MNDEQLKEKLEEYPRPSNCNKVIVPRVNPELWMKLSRNVRGDDQKTFRMQNKLCAVANIVLNSTEALLKGKSDPAKLGTDAIALMSHISYELAKRRRESIRPHLLKDYASLLL